MLARAFLRLTALEALRPSALLAAGGPFPTLAGLYVSDSRIYPIDDLNDEEKRPLIGVFTETSGLEKIAQSGPRFYLGEAELVFELSVVSTFVAAEGAEVVVDYADTDAALEITLDVMEEQIFHALHFGPTGALFRKMVKLPFVEWKSAMKHRAGEENVRLAARTIRAKIAVKETCYDAAPVTVPTDFDRLPSGLQSIAAQLTESTYLHDLALGMARVAPVMPVRVDLKSVAITAAPQPGVTGTVPVEGSADKLNEE
jgi:hypothetical protein